MFSADPAVRPKRLGPGGWRVSTPRVGGHPQGVGALTQLGP
jgi:hypothetical protein